MKLILGRGERPLISALAGENERQIGMDYVMSRALITCKRAQRFSLNGGDKGALPHNQRSQFGAVALPNMSKSLR